MMAVKKFTLNLHTGLVWIIWAVLLTWVHLQGKPDFATYAIWLTTGTAVYTGKRLFQKMPKFKTE